MAEEQENAENIKKNVIRVSWGSGHYPKQMYVRLDEEDLTIAHQEIALLIHRFH